MKNKSKYLIIFAIYCFIGNASLFAAQQDSTGNTTSDSSIQVQVKIRQKQEVVDTVLLKEKSRRKHGLTLDRNTRGLRENQEKYGVMALIALIVVGLISFLIFRSKD